MEASKKRVSKKIHSFLHNFFIFESSFRKITQNHVSTISLQYLLVRLISSTLHNSPKFNWYGGHQLDHQSSASPAKLGFV